MSGNPSQIETPGVSPSNRFLKEEFSDSEYDFLIPRDNDYSNELLKNKPPKICCMRGITSQYPRRIRMTQLLLAICNVANAALGAAVLGFPYAFSLCGWGGGLIIIFFSCLSSGYSLTIILRCARLHGATDYQETIAKMFGERVARMLAYAIVISCALANVSYLLVMVTVASTFCSELFPDNSFGTNRYFLTIVSWIAILPLQFVERIEVLAPYSVVGIFAVCFAVAMLIFQCIKAESFGPNIKFLNAKPIAFQALPIVMIGMFCHLAVVPACGGLRNYWPSMKYPIKIRFRALVVAAIGTMFVSTLVYLPSALAGYLLFGDTVKPNVFANFDNPGESVFVPLTADVKYSHLCMFVTTALGYPSSLFVARLSIFNAMFPKGVEHLSRIYVFVTIGFTLSCLALALIVQFANLDLDFLLALSSSTVGTVIQFIFPGLMLISIGSKYKGYSILLFGIFLSVSGLFICCWQVICNSTEFTFCDTMGIVKNI